MSIQRLNLAGECTTEVCRPSSFEADPGKSPEPLDG